MVVSGPGGWGASRSPRASARPGLSRRPGEARARAAAPAGPSARRLPRPRLPPARPRARSPAHTAGRGPRQPGRDRGESAAATRGRQGCANERGVLGRRPGSASDNYRTAHAGAPGPAPPAGQEESGHRLGFSRQARPAQAPG